ncbi:hypothetical protein RBH26_01595 [Natronolimnohabitans sp. A-GB9]|uniref:DUF7344 domain-containing protein n=1 Tax=Natronolimnohabitans sp. A-GB9 TaxID=3069757 RepID=UPI0027B79003|nr:hypothetical protein [Natronolimnohabitans sp. A-GB9]MDQ2049169.1 hypothetical protein [Natronolimnohabitans sp. A-GB9]
MNGIMSKRSIEFDTVLDLCRDRQRRIVLAVLADQQRSLTLNDLVKAISKHNHHRDVTAVSGDELSQIALSLYHEHIPMLETASVIDYDSERDLVEPTERFDELQPYLSAIVEADPELEPPVGL